MKKRQATRSESHLSQDFTGCEADNKIFEEQFEHLIKALRTGVGREAHQARKL